MSNVSALFRGRALQLADSVYLERADAAASSVEDFLRGLVARVPRLASRQRALLRFVATANSLEERIKTLSDVELRDEFQLHCRSMRKHGFSDALVARAFATVREASHRTLGKRHFDVQLMGGWVLLQGMVAEMQTGEGKTLVAALAASTAAATGAATHVITVNDYLAERDAEINSPLYEFLGLSVGIVLQGMKPDERRVEYAKDVVYVSNKEVVFDYLKDRIATGGITRSQLKLRRLYGTKAPLPLLLRGLHVAIVDEADSVLIDEARTPLIISETEDADKDRLVFESAIELARGMQLGTHFTVNAHRDVLITPSGEAFIDEATAHLGNVWKSPIWRRELSQKALSALHCFHLDQHYIVVDDKVQIVDEFTGRVMPDRSWERGLHQMIEAKERCEITGQRRTLSRMTYQRFFRRYLLLCGMTGTAAEVRRELQRVYELDVHRIPTNRPSQRRRFGNECYLAADRRWQRVVERATEISLAGRSVLIGTRSVEASEHLANLFAELGVAHTVLNARQDKAEADTISGAGQPGRITIATNMAGRGTDIQLHDSVRSCGGLHVILTEFHESSRVDRQLFGRSARQGEPGSVEAIISLEDDLFVRYVPWLRESLRATTSDHKLPPIAVSAILRIAQTIAERRNAKIRFATLKEDRRLQSILSFAGTPN